MFNINNLTRPQNVGQAIDNDNNSLNPYNGLNISNLSKPSDKQESQTISSLYNLLSNNDTIRWDDTGNIKIRSPHGLTTIKKIKFRSFTGDLLPYTNLELPELNIKLQVFCSDALTNSVYLIGRDNTEGIKPKHIIYSEQEQQTSDDSVIFEFTKAWTYDNSKDSQIEYNIEELINYLNECLLTWFGNIEIKYLFGGSDTPKEWHPYAFEYLPNNAINSYQPIANNNDILRIPYVGDDKFITYKVVDFSNVSYNTITQFTFPNGCVCMTTNNGNDFGSYAIYNLNTSSFIQANAWSQYHDDYFSSQRSHPIAGTNNYIIVAPFYSSYSGSERNTITVYDINTKTKYTIINTDFSEYNKYCIVGAIEDYDNKLIDVYMLTDTQTWYNPPTNIGIMHVIVNLTESTATISERNDNIITYDYYKQQHLNDIHDCCYFDKDDITQFSYNNNLFMSFGGKIIIKHNTKTSTWGIRCFTTKPYILNGTKYYLSNQLALADDTNISTLKQALHKDITRQSDIEYAFEHGYFITTDMSYAFTNFAYGPYALLDNNNNVVSYYDDVYKAVNNIEEMKIFNEFECYNMVATQKNYPMNTLNNKITYNDVLFTYKDGQISFPSICWSETEFITFVPIITTKPKYFNIKYNIPQTAITTNNYSIVQTDVNGEFHALNSHIFTTLETLLLLKYEYNDLMLRCNNFPNNDNFVFSINESCEIDFKTMQANSNNQELNINLTDSNGDVIMYDTLKALYGKVVLCIDWEG